jgi:PAS domain S-box-containing protein
MRMRPDEPVSILLVDDVPESLHALATMLEAPGHRVVTASSGSEALKHVIRESFAVILLDLVMPGMDGLEVAAMLKARERSRDIPIIFLTAADADVDRVMEAYSLGAVDWLPKPAQMPVVRAKVSVFVELHRKTEEVKRQAERLREADGRAREQQLRELRVASERRYRHLAESIPQVVFRASPDGAITFLSPRWMEYTGMLAASSHGWGWLDAVHSDDRETLSRVWRDAVTARAKMQVEARLLRASDGSWRWHLCQAVPERDEDGGIGGWVGTWTDVDAQRRADEERAVLLHRAERARAEAEAMQRRLAIVARVNGILTESLEAASTLERVARTLVESFGEACVIELRSDLARCEPIVAHRDRDQEDAVRTFARGDVAAGEGPALAVASSGTAAAPGWAGRRRLRAGISVGEVSLGAITVFERAASPFGKADASLLEDLAKRIAMFLEKVRLYDEARRAIAIRDEFLSIAAHELRTPVTALRLQIEMLARMLQGESLDAQVTQRARTRADAAVRQLGRFVELIDALLDVSRISSKQVLLSPEECDLAQLVREVVARSSEAAARAGCSVSVRGAEAARGSWDRMRVEQIAVNLLGNAIKYGAGAPIEIVVEAGEDLARLVVTDQGIGIAPEHLGRVFDRFERAAPSGSYGGLGLGLYITRQMVLAHGGTIAVESRVGAGSTFTVALPRRLDLAAPSAGEGGGGAPAAAAPDAEGAPTMALVASSA